MGKKMWAAFQFIDNQHLEITLFNEDGQVSTSITDMQKGDNPQSNESEKFVCNQTSWQWAAVRDSSYSKVRRSYKYAKTTKLPDGTLKIESKFYEWNFIFNFSSFEHTSIGYFRKADLTVDDIRAMNDKAKRAIEQYDYRTASRPVEK